MINKSVESHSESNGILIVNVMSKCKQLFFCNSRFDYYSKKIITQYLPIDRINLFEGQFTD